MNGCLYRKHKRKFTENAKCHLDCPTPVMTNITLEDHVLTSIHKWFVRNSQITLVAEFIRLKKVYTFVSRMGNTIPKSVKCIHSATKLQPGASKALNNLPSQGSGLRI